MRVSPLRNVTRVFLPPLHRQKISSSSFRKSSSPPLSLTSLVRLQPGSTLETDGCRVTAYAHKNAYGHSRGFDFVPKGRARNIDLALMHGNPGGPQDLAFLAQALAETAGYRVGIFEAPGHGFATTGPKWQWSITDSKAHWLKEMQADYAERLSVSKINVGAHSTGSEVSFTAELYRRQIGGGLETNRFVFINPYLPTVHNIKPLFLDRLIGIAPHRLVQWLGPLFVPGIYGDMIHEYKKVKDRADIVNWAAANDQVFRQGGKRFHLRFAQLIKGATEEEMALKREGAKYSEKMLGQWTASGGFSRDVLVASSTFDRVIKYADAERVVAGLRIFPGQNEHEVAFKTFDAGHMLPLTHPKELASAIRDFVG